ncbi:cyclic peptide export ABC transporter [Pseudoalteromonas rubra]|uniref:cyclic peptide export ABC transporter n=1 Tax=Pseudoalteromonas rubra TaxID=43658 RepID=UPI000F7775CE|nr:cyclic peptide export ABC transporter [Pseudoalteromonas rubra]
MKVLPFLIKFSPGLLIFSVIAGIVSGTASTLVIAVINDTISEISNPLTLFVWLFLGGTSVALLAGLVSRLLLLKLSVKAVKKWRLELCKQLLASPYSELEKHGSSKLMATLTEDIHTVAEALTEFPVLCTNLAVILACFGYLFWLSWSLALAYLAVFTIGVITYEAIARKTRPLLQDGRVKWDDLVDHYNCLINGNKELKLQRSRRDNFYEQELTTTADEMMNVAWGWHKVFAIADSYGQFIYSALIGLIVFVAPLVTFYETSVLTGFVLMALYMRVPITTSVGSIPMFHQADVAMDKINSLNLSLSSLKETDVKSADNKPYKPTEFNSLEFNEVEYKYQKENDSEKGFSIGPLSLRIGAGEVIFVIGGNGCGKSSFVKLLTGLYTPSSGEVLLNNKPIDNSNRDDYRQNISAIFSDYYLFKNLYGLLNKTGDSKVQEYLIKLGLTDKVSVEDGKLSTVELSSGQRKRLALLISFIEDRNIYVFDEWAADQDPVFKDIFYHDLLPELKAKGKTVIVISHDDYYFNVADRIIRFNDGRIIQDVTNTSHSARRKAFQWNESITDEVN